MLFCDQCLLPGRFLFLEPTTAAGSVPTSQSPPWPQRRNGGSRKMAAARENGVFSQPPSPTWFLQNLLLITCFAMFNHFLKNSKKDCYEGVHGSDRNYLVSWCISPIWGTYDLLIWGLGHPFTKYLLGHPRRKGIKHPSLPWGHGRQWIHFSCCVHMLSLEIDDFGDDLLPSETQTSWRFEICEGFVSIVPFWKLQEPTPKTKDACLKTSKVVSKNQRQIEGVP